MIKSLQDISRRLIEDYDPDKIILLGSRAGGEDRESGDIDLVIVKKTDKRPLDRRIEVETLLADRMVPIDIVVYTPDEMRNLYSMGSPFVEEIVEKGRLIYMRKATAAWIRDASQELTMLTEKDIIPRAKDPGLAVFLRHSLRTLRTLRETKDFFSRPLRSSPQSTQGKINNPKDPPAQKDFCISLFAYLAAFA
jgi:predicted nucleotidyltransferase